jgi:hypothetical protein
LTKEKLGMMQQPIRRKCILEEELIAMTSTAFRKMKLEELYKPGSHADRIPPI